MSRILIFVKLYFLINFIKCIEDPSPKLNKRLPNFRRQVEELSDDFTTDKSEEDANVNLVAFLVKNAKEIFGETEETTTTTTLRTPKYTLFPEDTTFPEEKTFPKDRSFSEESLFPEMKIVSEDKNFGEDNSLPEIRTFAEVTTAYQKGSTSVSLFNKTTSLERFNVTSRFQIPVRSPPPTSVASVTTSTTNFTIAPTTTIAFRYNDMHSKNITIPLPTLSTKLPTRTEFRIRTPIEFTVNVELIRKEVMNLTNIDNNVDKINLVNTEPRRKQHRVPSFNDIPFNEKKSIPSRRSCIACNNVQLQECNEPKNRLVPTVICEHEEDLCYSQQTPFGLIDRGCFNVNLNVTTYVCSCNLCNYISISEMPYTFAKRKEWVDNVIDLSRTRSFRTSIYKDMSCLSCEVNATANSFDMLDNANCLEGNIGVLPTKQCADDEICGVKALRSNGYLWRGCLKSPLYNYWWSLCDSDLCNTDSVVSLYDDF